MAFSKIKSRNFDKPWRKTPGRLLGTFLIRFYQITFSGFLGQHCRHLPTCSEYAYEAIARHGLCKGCSLFFFRIIRCGPWGTYGFDPVPNSLKSLTKNRLSSSSKTS
ncbi:MAG: hypothetical protein JSC161_000265 [Candidatus Tokpelaia sp. JSC161]|jgi:hypothetical protein|nr:MAG: hypothetical protein JSC161_000265 [Candidatus Tokpelaia sp. JSC161]